MHELGQDLVNGNDAHDVAWDHDTCLRCWR
jgi:hypothetical protein